MRCGAGSPGSGRASHHQLARSRGGMSCAGSRPVEPVGQGVRLRTDYGGGLSAPATRGPPLPPRPDPTLRSGKRPEPVMPNDEQTRGQKAALETAGPADAGTDRPSGEAMPMPADVPGNRPAMLTVPGERAVAEPIRVTNTLWRSTHETAYGGGLPPATTHLP